MTSLATTEAPAVTSAAAETSALTAAPTLEELNAISFQIIAAAGNARSLYMEAVAAARKDDFEQSERLMDEARESFSLGHAAHTSLIQGEAAGSPVEMTLMLTHAEDQLMSAEEFGVIAEELITLYRKVNG